MNNDFTFDFNSLNFSNTPSSGSNGFGDSNFSFPAFGSEFSAPVNNIEANINPSFDSNSSFPTNDTKNDTPIPFDTFGFDKGVSSFDTQFESNKNSFGSFSLEDSNSNLQKTNTPPSNFTTSFDNLGGKDSFSTSSFELPVEKKELSHSNSFSNELSTSLDNAVDFSESSYSKFDSSFDKFNNQFNSDVKLNSPTHFLSDPSLSSSFSSSISSEMTFSTSFDQLEKSNSEVNKQNNYFSSQAWNSPDLSSTEKKYDQFNQSGDDLHFITNEKSKSDSFASNEFLSTFDSPSTSLDHFEQPIVSSLSSLSSSDSSSSFSSKFENSSSTFTSDFDNKLTNNDNHFSPNFNDNFNIDNGNESQSNGLLWVSSINDEPKKDFKTSFDFSAAMDKLDYLENECDPKANSSFPPPDSNLPSFNSINTPINDDNNNNNNNNISFEDSFNLNETSFKPSTEFNTSFDNNNSNKFDQFDSKEGFGDTGQTGKSIDFAPSFDSVGKFDDFGGDSFAKEISFPSSSDRNIDFGTNNDDFKSTSDFNSSFDSKFDQFNANFDDNSFKFEGFDSFGSNNNNNSSNNNDDFGFSANFETSLPSSSSSISSPSNFEFNNDLGKTNDNKFNDFNNFNNNNNINNNETYLKNNENNSSGGLLEIGSKFLLDYLKKELENITAKEEISSSSPLLSATLSEFYSSPNETGIWKGKCNKCNAKRTSNSTLCLICGTSLQSVQNKREIWAMHLPEVKATHISPLQPIKPADILSSTPLSPPITPSFSLMDDHFTPDFASVNNSAQKTDLSSSFPLSSSNFPPISAAPSPLLVDNMKNSSNASSLLNFSADFSLVPTSPQIPMSTPSPPTSAPHDLDFSFFGSTPSHPSAPSSTPSFNFNEFLGESKAPAPVSNHAIEEILSTSKTIETTMAQGSTIDQTQANNHKIVELLSKLPDLSFMTSRTLIVPSSKYRFDLSSPS